MHWTAGFRLCYMLDAPGPPPVMRIVRLIYESRTGVGADNVTYSCCGGVYCCVHSLGTSAHPGCMPSLGPSSHNRLAARIRRLGPSYHRWHWKAPSADNPNLHGSFAWTHSFRRPCLTIWPLLSCDDGSPWDIDATSHMAVTMLSGRLKYCRPFHVAVLRVP